jgi:hypothetical protein
LKKKKKISNKFHHLSDVFLVKCLMVLAQLFLLVAREWIVLSLQQRGVDVESNLADAGIVTITEQ